MRKVAAAMTKAGFKVSHNAISQRAKKEGWFKQAEICDPSILETKTAKIHGNPVTHGERRMVTMGKRSPENAAKILDYLEQGFSQNVAAAKVGISPSTLSAWLKDDPELGELARVSRIKGHAADERIIMEARDRGDWKAALTRLERSKDVADAWKQEDTAQKGTGNFNIVFNFSRDDDESPVIDITPND